MDIDFLKRNLAKTAISSIHLTGRGNIHNAKNFWYVAEIYFRCYYTSFTIECQNHGNEATINNLSKTLKYLDIPEVTVDLKQDTGARWRLQDDIFPFMLGKKRLSMKKNGVIMNFKITRWSDLLNSEGK